MTKEEQKIKEMKDRYNIPDTANMQDNTICPQCGSKNIEYIHEPCMCGHYGDDSCWTRPSCLDCNCSAPYGAGNSDGGMWYRF